MSSSRSRVRRLALSAAAASLALIVPATALPAAAAATSVDWKAGVAAVAGAPYTQNSTAYKSAATRQLSAVLTDQLGHSRVQAVDEDLATGYLDSVRFRSEGAGRDAYSDDLKLASHLKSRLTGSGAPTGQAATAHVAGLAALLYAGRLSADAAIGDAAAALGDNTVPAGAPVDEAEEPRRVEDVKDGDDMLAEAPSVTTPGGTAAALHELQQARKDLDKSEKAVGKALPVTALVHQGLAWRHAYHALVHLGITYEGDRDGDGVKDLAEMRLGASPLRADSDGDGLTDGFEIEEALTFHQPNDADSDDDQVSDAAEDIDGDGLTAAQEQQHGTSPTEADTDGDRVSDGAEVAAGTDPRKADTDADGLRDGVEPKAGTDPTNPDTDGDGIKDGDEQQSFHTNGPDGIAVTLTGTGDLVSSLRITKVTGDQRSGDATPGQVGPAYDFSLSPPAYQGFQQAQLSLPYDPAKLGAGNPSDLKVFYLDPDRGWRLASDVQAVDPTRHTVTATVDHFSTYAIFDIRNWGQTWTASQNPCKGRTGGGGGTDIVLLDLALVLDSSGSMSTNDPLGLRRTAAKSFVDALLPEDRAAVVDFDSFAFVRQGLTTDKVAVKGAIDQIDSSGGTNIGAGVSAGNQILLNNGDPDRARMMILLTDGEGSYSSSLTQQASLAGIAIYTIGLGSSIDEPLLQGIASGTGGQYYHVATADQLPEVFRRISDDTGGDPTVTKDTDEDGLTDCQEMQGMRSGMGITYTSDPTLKDTDGDGLEDGEEIPGKDPLSDYIGDWLLDPLGLEDPDVPVWQVISDPRQADTDGDGLSDPAEFDADTDPFGSDSDGDGLTDGLEVGEVGSAPLAFDTDGDEFDDGYEHSHRGDGLDPLFFDEHVSAWSYAVDFAKGFVLGDIVDDDSLAWLAGALASGGSSAIPVIGWIIGGIADLRDTIANAIKGEWAGAGLSLVGVVPYAGDAIAIPGKAVKFVLRNTDKADEVMTFIAKIDDVPQAIKIEAASKILRNWDELKTLGLSDDLLITLMKGRTNLDELAEAIRGAGHVAGTSAPFFAKGRDGELFLEGLYGATVKGRDLQVWFSTKVFRGKGRFVDVLDTTTQVAHESKVGFVKYSTSITNQIEKDAFLKANGDFAGVHWHFFASSASNTIGADPRVLDLLRAKGIPYTIHLP